LIFAFGGIFGGWLGVRNAAQFPFFPSGQSYLLSTILFVVKIFSIIEVEA